MSYQPQQTPSTGNAILERFVAEELRRIAEQFQKVDLILLQELHVAPKKPRTGMIVLADGTDWNPGSGQGVYAYYNSAWSKLG